MANRFTTVCICSQEYDESKEEMPDIRLLNNVDLCQTAIPMPKDTEDVRVWREENWGNRRGTYDTKANYLGGDGSFVTISFQTDWKRLPFSTLRSIEMYLMKEFNLANFNWVFCDPKDGEISTI